MVVYIETEGKKLRLENDSLEVYGSGEPRSLPLEVLDSIVIRGNITLTSNILTGLLEKGVSITFLNYYGQYIKTLTPDIKGNVAVRHQQLRLADNETERLRLAIIIIQGKIKNQLAVLNRYIRNYGSNDNIDKIKQLPQDNCHLIEAATSILNLMGYEGYCSEQYFSVFNVLIRNSEIKFNGRYYNPPTDEFNAMLSYGYTLLRAEVEKNIRICGLDPYVGFIHSERSGKPSLALDMMEEFRPYFVDRMIISLINRGQVRKEQFEHKENEVYCGEIVRMLIIKEFEARKNEAIIYKGESETYRNILLKQTRLLVKHIKGVCEYEPFVWR